MTSNQIANNSQREEARSNVVREEETKRHNKESERTANISAAGQLLRGIGSLASVGNQSVSTLGKLAQLAAKGGGNHPSWYNRIAGLVPNTANIAFSNPYGYNTPTYYSGAVQAYAALVARLNFLPTIGVATGEDDNTINVAAVGIYAAIRAKISGRRTYDRNDVMQVLLAMDSLFMLRELALRAWSFKDLLTSENKVYGSKLIEAMGFDAESMRDNPADWLFAINSLSNKLNTLPMPGNVPYFSRHMWLCGTAFIDTPQPKHRIYVPHPVFLYQYDWENAKLIQVTTPNQMTLTTFTNLYNIMLNALINVEDVGTILGDLKTAFGDNLYVLYNDISEIEPRLHYSEEVLAQVENATIVGTRDLSVITNWDIIQEGQNLKYAGDLTVQQPTYSSVQRNTPYILDYDHPSFVSYDNNMVASRFMAVLSNAVAAASDLTSYNILDCGSEVLSNITVYYNDSPTVGTISWGEFNVRGTQSIGIGSDLKRMCVINQFAHFPRINVAIGFTDAGGTSHSGDNALFNWKPNYFTTIPESVVRNMNYAALLSELAIGIVGYQSEKQNYDSIPRSKGGSKSKGKAKK